MDYRFKILEFSNYDGDSFDLTMDLGFDIVTHKKCRINGVDTPELRGGTDLEKAAGRLARDEARAWCMQAMGKDKIYFVSEGYKGKFGRPLGDIQDAEGNSMRQYLLDKHLGVPYEGQAKSEVDHLHAINLQHLLKLGVLKDPDDG